MDENQARRDDLVVAYIGGGSRGWAWKLMADLALEPSLGGLVRLHDIDRPAARTNAAIGNRLAADPASLAKWRYEAVDDLGKALDGADFVVASILPGDFDDMAVDIHAPERLGIWQSVGDTTGPGGVLRALRTMPTYMNFAREIRGRCPGAWVINYTNPMAACLGALREEFPGIKALGCCHEVFGTLRFLAEVAALALGEISIGRKDISYNVHGVNHFTWIDRASVRGLDLLPLYHEFCASHAASGWEPDGPGSWERDPFSSAEKVKMDLFLTYGLVAAAGDRHLAEFMGARYLADPQTARAWKFSLTTAAWRKEDLGRRRERAARLEGGSERLGLEASGEEGARIMKALCGLGDFVTNANLPNAGQEPDLPRDCVVETKVLFSRDSAAPVHAGRLSPGVAALSARPAWNQIGLVRACAERDLGPAYQAFLNDGQMERVTERAARGLFEEMLRATEDRLGGWYGKL